jgi:DNA polymerase III alpha subunit
MSQNFDKLVQTIEACRPDVEKASAGNKAATSRVRKAMQEVKNIAQEIRKEMLEVRDAGGATPPAKK